MELGTRDTARGTLAGVGASVLWGLHPTLVVWAGFVPVFEILALGFLTASLCFAGRRMATGRSVTGMFRMTSGLFLAGTVALLGDAVCFILAARHIGASETQVIKYLWPILMLLMAAVTLGTRLRGRQVVGILIAFAGAVIVIGPEGGFDAAPAGIALAFLSGLAWASYSLYRMHRPGGPGDAMGTFCAVAGLACAGITVATGTATVPAATQLAAIIAMGVASFATANLLWDFGVRVGNTEALSVFAYVTPLIGVAVLWLSGTARPQAAVGVGAVLIVLGPLVAGRR